MSRTSAHRPLQWRYRQVAPGVANFLRPDNLSCCKGEAIFFHSACVAPQTTRTLLLTPRHGPADISDLRNSQTCNEETCGTRRPADIGDLRNSQTAMRRPAETRRPGQLGDLRNSETYRTRDRTRRPTTRRLTELGDLRNSETYRTRRPAELGDLRNSETGTTRRPAELAEFGDHRSRRQFEPLIWGGRGGTTSARKQGYPTPKAASVAAASCRFCVRFWRRCGSPPGWTSIREGNRARAPQRAEP